MSSDSPSLNGECGDQTAVINESAPNQSVHTVDISQTSIFCFNGCFVSSSSRIAIGGDEVKG